MNMKWAVVVDMIMAVLEQLSKAAAGQMVRTVVVLQNT